MRVLLIFGCSGSYLLHEYQLLATMHGVADDSAIAQAYSNTTVKSKAQIEAMNRMVGAILREFPVEHTPELSPAALFCPYKAAMLTSLLNRIQWTAAKAEYIVWQRM